LNSSNGAHVLLADVGGTNVRFALADPAATTPLLTASICRYAVADFASLADAARHYLDSSSARVEHGVFAVAGRVDGDEARMTNHSWVVSRPRVQQELGLASLRLVNDFVAQAMAVRLLRDEDTLAIGPSMPAVDATGRTCAVLGPGTGLGVGALIVRDGRAIALATEGGHAGFAPVDAEEVAILQRLSVRFGRVSNERLVSGDGLVNLHRALADIAGLQVTDDLEPRDITAGADAGDAACLHTIDVFCGIFGSIAGDMVLALGAWDGVFLSGGLVPVLLPALQQPRFRQRFQEKGRYSAVVAKVPTLAVLHPEPGLLGAAAIACDLASAGRSQ
jgi:glucokinase